MRRYTVGLLLLLTVLPGLPLRSHAQSTDATITGVVIDAVTGHPLPNINVSITYYSSFGSGSYGIVKTDADGRYRQIVDATAGYYVLEYSDPRTFYLHMWYEHATSFETATPIILTPGEKRQANVHMDQAGGISGVLRHNVLTADPGALSIQVFDVQTGLLGATKTVTSSGDFRFDGLVPGDYNASIAYQYEYEGYIWEASWGYYQRTLDQERATTITVTSGMTSTITVDWTATGEITGIVRDQQTHLPVLHRFQVTATTERGALVGMAVTRPDGRYRLKHVLPGNYIINFTGLVWPERIECTKGCSPAPHYHERVRHQPVTVGPGQTITGVDGEVGKQIEGNVFLPLVIR